MGPLASENGFNVCGRNPSRGEVFPTELAISKERDGWCACVIILQVILVKAKDTLGLLIHDEGAAKFIVSWNPGSIRTPGVSRGLRAQNFHSLLR